MEVARGKRRNGELFLKDIEFQFCTIKNSRQMVITTAQQYDIFNVELYT